MATAEDVIRLAHTLAGTIEKPHFERRAFAVKRIYATLAVDGKSLNLKLTPEEQQIKCEMAPDLFQPIDNAWGRQGWTTARLPSLGEADLMAALQMAWRHAIVSGARRRR